MYHYRQALMRMRHGDSDRDIARSRLMGRKKAAHLRGIATERGWLVPETALPDDAQLAEVLASGTALPASCVSTLEPWRAEIAAWMDAGISGVRIHQERTKKGSKQRSKEAQSKEGVTKQRRGHIL